MGHTADSIATLEQIIQLDPLGLPKQELILQMVDSLYYGGQGARALELLREQQHLSPTPLGQWYVASLEDALGNDAGHLIALNESLRLDETFAPARVDLAIHHARGGDLETATPELEQAIADRPYHA